MTRSARRNAVSTAKIATWGAQRVDAVEERADLPPRRGAWAAARTQAPEDHELALAGGDHVEVSAHARGV